MCIYGFREDSRTIWLLQNVCTKFFQVLRLSLFYHTYKHTTLPFSPLHQLPSGRSWEGQWKKMISYLGKDLPNTFTIFKSPVTSTWFFSFCSSKYLTGFSKSAEHQLSLPDSVVPSHLSAAVKAGLLGENSANNYHVAWHEKLIYGTTYPNTAASLSHTWKATAGSVLYCEHQESCTVPQ